MHGDERQLLTGGASASPVFSAQGARRGPLVASGVAARVGLAECFEAGRATTRALLAGMGAVRAGVTTLSVARAVEAELSRVGAIGVRGVPQGRGGPAFPEACIVSVNDVAADGIPDERVLRAGDVVTIDAPACVRVRDDFAWADAAVSRTVPDERGEMSGSRLPFAACAVVRAIVGEMRAGGRWTTAAAAGRARARALGVALVEGLDGHGIGRAMHQPPRLALTPMRGREGHAGEVGEVGEVEFEAGMLLAVEAVVAEGVDGAETVRTRTDGDGWSERTEGGEPAAGWEVTVRIEREGVRLVAGWVCEVRGAD